MNKKERIESLRVIVKEAQLEIQKLEYGEFEPCPFCGERPSIKGGIRYSSKPTTSLKCCMEFIIDGGIEPALKNWNRRVTT